MRKALIDNRTAHFLPRRHTDTLVGREKEVRTLLRHISNRESLHIYGPAGTGKSALLDWAYDNWAETGNSLVPIYCRSSRTLRNALLQMVLFLLYHFRHLDSIDKFKRVKEIRYPTDIKKLSIRELRSIVYSYISLGDFCVILDHLEYVTPRINGFLYVLYKKAMVITASKQSWELFDYSFWGNLEYQLYLLPKLKIENLTRNEAFLMMKNNAEDALETVESLFEDIYRITKGNPGMTTKIIAKAIMPKYRHGGRINLKVIMIDLKIEDVGEIG